MASASPNYPSTGIRLSKENVSRKLQQSRTFSWCLYRKRDIIRHVGFVIVFDGKPFCTVDFTVENPTDPFCLLACPSKVLIETVPKHFKSYVDCGSAIQRLLTDSKDGRQRAKGIIDKIKNITPSCLKTVGTIQKMFWTEFVTLNSAMLKIWKMQRRCYKTRNWKTTY